LHESFFELQIGRNIKKWWRSTEFSPEKIGKMIQVRFADNRFSRRRNRHKGIIFYFFPIIKVTLELFLFKYCNFGLNIYFFTHAQRKHHFDQISDFLVPDFS